MKTFTFNPLARAAGIALLLAVPGAFAAQSGHTAQSAPRTAHDRTLVVHDRTPVMHIRTIGTRR